MPRPISIKTLCRHYGFELKIADFVDECEGIIGFPPGNAALAPTKKLIYFDRDLSDANACDSVVHELAHALRGDESNDATHRCEGGLMVLQYRLILETTRARELLDIFREYGWSEHNDWSEEMTQTSAWKYGEDLWVKTRALTPKSLHPTWKWPDFSQLTETELALLTGEMIWP